MQGYDEERALAFIRKSIDAKAYAEIAPSIDGYLRQAQRLDLAYMHEVGALDEAGFAGDGEYDEDDVFEYIVEEIVKERGLDDEQAIVVASLVDAYMGAQEAYLRKEGLG